MIDDEGGFGVYVHWPYCARICPYCDFNVRKNRAVDPEAWIAAFARDLRWWAERTPKARPGSVYFGGGTPSLAPDRVLAFVLEETDRLWGLPAGAEITVEANPEDASEDRLAALGAVGATRLSLGVQSLRDEALAFLGRSHDAAGARRAIERSMAAFAETSFDLIYARPGQTAADWAAELSEALSFAPRHLSLYQLTIEPGTAFGVQVRKGRWRPAPDDLSADHYDVAEALASAAGLSAYEVSNHAASGARSRHNLVYWRFGAYAGIGPGAHGRLHADGRRSAVVAASDPADYLAAADPFSVEDLSREDAEAEFLAFGLRIEDGVSLDRWTRLAGRPPPEDRVAPLVSDGLLRRDAGRLSATHAGRRVLDSVLAALLV